MQAPRRKTLVEEDSDYKKPPALPTTIENIQQIVSPPPSAPPLEKSGRRKTVIASTQNLGDKPPLQGQKNKLVAFLLTYSIDPMGQYYEVREGRHIIGGGERADIFIPNDSLMSSEHAILLYRRGRFFFQDNLSTNGSFINGQEAVGQIKLNNYDEITVGSTTLRLVMAQEEKSKEQEEKGGVDVSGEA
jgi:pSer/pThr/pTyr-binding forkhead associated (FHA) protein